MSACLHAPTRICLPAKITYTPANRKLLLSWKPSYDCNATFFDLFDGWPPSMEVLPLVLDDGDKGVLAVKGMVGYCTCTMGFPTYTVFSK